MQRLHAFALQDPALQAQLADAAFEDAPVRWVITIAQDGAYLGLTDRKGDAKRTPTLRIPKVAGRTAAPVPALAVDSRGYILGFGDGDDPKDAPKFGRQHAAARALLDEAIHATDDTGLRAIAAFYADPDNLARLRRDLADRKLDTGDRYAFALASDGALLVCQRGPVRQFWIAHSAAKAEARSGSRPTASGTRERCLCCGEEKPIADRHLTKIMGVPEGQASGTSLVSFNEDAFESYGWKESYNSPVCLACVETYTRALNRLLIRDNSPRTRYDEAQTAFLYWTVGGSPFDAISLIEQPQPEAVRELLAAARSGRLPAAVDGEAFCTLALAGAGGRAMVRQWLDTTIPEVRRNLARWFEDLTIVAFRDQVDRDGNVLVPRGELARPPGLNTLLATLVRDPKELPRHLAPALLRAAITGAPLPIAALALAVRRCAVEQGPGRPWTAPARMGLIRATLNRSPETAGGAMRPMSEVLDTEQTSKGYLCGRLLAVLEGVQFGAVGDVGADIVDRFYGRAATAPVAAFPILMRLAQSHLRTLKRDKPGLAVTYERQLGEIATRLGTTFPSSLTLAEQGRFALGYYHQRASAFTPRPTADDIPGDE